MLSKGHRTTFGAKDTHYYWALDPDAMPESAPLSDVYDVIAKLPRGTEFKTLPYQQLFKDRTQTLRKFYAQDALIYAQGAVFPTIPGKYIFPQNEGHVIITSDQRVNMKTTMNGAAYISGNPQPHPDTWNGQFKFDLGFMTVF